jgi:hypothetical protein
LIETLALFDRERIDRQTVERLFDLRKTAAFQLLRMGAEPVGHSLAISRTLLMARQREVQEHPQWRWERERRIRIRDPNGIGVFSLVSHQSGSPQHSAFDIGIVVCWYHRASKS